MEALFKIIKDNLNKKLKNNSKTIQIKEISLDEIKLKFGENDHTIKLNWDQEEFREEISRINKKNIIDINNINFLNIDTSLTGYLINLDQTKNFIDNEINLEGEISGLITGLVKDYKSNLLLNIHELLDWKQIEEKFNSNIEVVIDDVIKKEFLVIDISNYNQQYQDVKLLINSVITSILYKNNIKLIPTYMNKKYSHDFNFEKVDVKYLKSLDMTKYFISAENLNSLQYKFLEYYHILEYQFLMESIKKLKNILNDFGLKEIRSYDLKDADYYSLLKDLVDTDKKNNELNQLSEVLYSLGYKGIVTSLNNIQNLEQILNSSVWDEPSINTKLEFKPLWSNKKLKENVEEELSNKFISTLATKIYKIRNIIVHTKRDENQKLFTPNVSNLENIEGYISLIREIAFSLLNRRR